MQDTNLMVDGFDVLDRTELETVQGGSIAVVIRDAVKEMFEGISNLFK